MSFPAKTGFHHGHQRQTIQVSVTSVAARCAALADFHTKRQRGAGRRFGVHAHGRHQRQDTNGKKQNLRRLHQELGVSGGKNFQHFVGHKHSQLEKNMSKEIIEGNCMSNRQPFRTADPVATFCVQMSTMSIDGNCFLSILYMSV